MSKRHRARAKTVSDEVTGASEDRSDKDAFVRRTYHHDPKLSANQYWSQCVKRKEPIVVAST